MRYCRFVISDDLGAAGLSWLHPTKSGVLCGASEVYLHTKNQNNPVCLSKILFLDTLGIPGQTHLNCDVI